jgi:hypothetical protein
MSVDSNLTLPHHYVPDHLQNNAPVGNAPAIYLYTSLSRILAGTGTSVRSIPVGTGVYPPPYKRSCSIALILYTLSAIHTILYTQ